MEIIADSSLTHDPVARTLINYLESNRRSLGLDAASVYYSFPIYKDDNGNPVKCRVLLISKRHGVIVFGTSEVARKVDVASLNKIDEELEHTYSHIFSRLIKNRDLRRTKNELKFSVVAAIYAPALEADSFQWESDTEIVCTDARLTAFINEANCGELDDSVFNELVATLDGAKGLSRPKERVIANDQRDWRGALVARLEAEINNFDRGQKRGQRTEMHGPQRIRGLAGSGKTVVLAMRAALLHLEHPEATILYTFYTKSLYQHVRKLINRFYKQFDEREVDWTKVQLEHAWGGQMWPGVYYRATKAFGAEFLNFPEAVKHSPNDPFGFACERLMAQARIKPLYDYVLIDEGQDFPTSFIRLCSQLAEQSKFVLAYDELQTIFRTTAPSASEVFGVDEKGKTRGEFTEEIVLHKCYRNPPEILVCAHALGFGIYSTKPVQMLENKEHWTDIGYIVHGELNPREPAIIERPLENSITVVSNKCSIDDIVSMYVAKTFEDEVNHVATEVEKAISEGLRPDDIMIITLDDRNARSYLNGLWAELNVRGVPAYNAHGDFSAQDFQKEGQVTLSTVHKAKGNEAYFVFVVGAGAVYPSPSGRQRNMLFTSMTRAKAWLRISGIGERAELCATELNIAKANFPMLRFVYPTSAEIRTMRRDLEAEASKRLRAERLLDEVTLEMSEHEIQEYLRRRQGLKAASPAEKKKKR